MNKIFIVYILLSVLVSALSAEPVFINSDGNRKAVVGLKFDGRVLSPIVPCYERYRLPGEASNNEFVHYLHSALHLETGIPSVLYGENISLIDPLFGMVNIGGKDTIPFELLLLSIGWLETKFLGMVYARFYPYLYVSGDGWIYLTEVNPGVYYMYSFELEKWYYVDLFQMNMPQLPEKP